MIKSPQVQTPDTERKKPVGRWDAVMSKITKTDPNKTNLKEVKSKVYNNVRPAVIQKSPNNKLFSPNGHNIIRNSPNVQTPTRRVRNRSSTGSVSKSGNLENSINSSLSDLSAATLPPNNKTIGEF
nr:unnamed protein product [Callosobruchus chinensis]